jgi:hypothetical protein
MEGGEKMIGHAALFIAALVTSAAAVLGLPPSTASEGCATRLALSQPTARMSAGQPQCVSIPSATPRRTHGGRPEEELLSTTTEVSVSRGGRATEAQLPSGTLSFLFTDIEGSTRLLARLGDRYSSVLSDHQRLLRAAFSDACGRGGTRRTTGARKPFMAR